MPGLIGFNFLRSGDDLRQIIRRTRPRVSLFFEDAIRMVEDVDGQVEIPIGRMWLEGGADQVHPRLAQWAGQPTWPTDDQNYEQGRQLANALVMLWPAVPVFQGYNEWPTYNNVPEHAHFAVFELGFVDRMHELGRMAVVLNPPVGNLNSEHLRVFDELLSKADFLGAHTYGSQAYQLMSVDAPYFSQRPRTWIEDAQRRGVRWPPLIRTECGTWWPWKGSHPDVRLMSVEAIRDDVLWLGDRMTPYTYEVGACLYCCGSNGDPRWDGFDVSNEPTILDAIERFNAEHPAPAYHDSATTAIPEVPTVPTNEQLRMYLEWAAARLTAGEDPRDTAAFVQHLKALGADWQNPHGCGLPYVVVLPKA